MAVSPKWMARPQLEARQAVLSAARGVLLSMAHGTEPPIMSAVPPSPELARAAYGVAAATIAEALAEVNRAINLSWRQGGGAALDEMPAGVFRALNRVPSLRLVGVRARLRAEAREAGDES